MTSPIALAAVLANLAVLLALAAAVVKPSVSRLSRLVIATFAFACAWLVNATFDATRLPGWAVFMGGGVIVVSIVAVIASLQLWTQAGDGGESEAEHRGDEGEGGPRRRWPDAPQRGGGGSDPNWWPEFERRLASYVAEREREMAGVRTSPPQQDVDVLTVHGEVDPARPWEGRQEHP